MEKFSFKPYLGGYLVTNLDKESGIDFKVEKRTSNGYREVLKKSIDKNKFTTFFLDKDGDYKMTVYTQELYTDLPKNIKYYVHNQEIFTFSSFLNLRKRLIKEIKDFLCCKDCYKIHCDDCVDKSCVELQQIQNIYNELFVYQHVINKYDAHLNSNINIHTFYEKVVEHYRYTILASLKDQITYFDFLAQVKGSLELFRKFVAIHYLSFFFKDYYSAVNKQDREYLRDLYDIKNLRGCIEKTGITIETVKEIFKNHNIKLSNRPEVEDVNIPLINSSKVYIFKPEDFKTKAEFIRIVRLPEKGDLIFRDKKVSEGFTFKPSEIPQLSYTPTGLTTIKQYFDDMFYVASNSTKDEIYLDKLLWSKIAKIKFEIL